MESSATLPANADVNGDKCKSMGSGIAVVPSSSKLVCQASIAVSYMYH